MPTDRGVSLYRRRIRQLIRNLAKGEEPDQPGQLPDEAVRTYGQDTILHLPEKSKDDRKYLKKVTKEVMEMQFAAEGMPLADRDAPCHCGAQADGAGRCGMTVGPDQTHSNELLIQPLER